MKVLNLTVEEKPFLLQQLDALEKYGVEGDLVTVPGERIVTEDEIKRHSVFDYVRFYPKVLKQSLSGYDLVHAHFGLTTPFAIAQPNRPIVMSLWDWDLYGEYGWVSRRCANWSDAVIVRNKETAADLDRDAFVVERGVDLEKFSQIEQKEAQSRVGWNPDAYHVLFPYSPSRSKKNYPLAERVVSTVGKQINYNVKLNVVYNEQHDMIPVYMNAADALLLTSNSEGSPNSVKEALACNLPVVSTDVGDVSELLEGITNSKVCGNESELVDALRHVLLSDERSNGRKSIKDLTWDRTAEDVIDIYNTVL